jgi:hypothetical protein
MIDMKLILPPRDDKQDHVKIRVVWFDSSKGRGEQIHSVEERFPNDMPIGQAVDIIQITAGRSFGDLIINGKAG